MKKKVVSLVLALSLITSMASVAFASTNDKPKAYSPVLLLSELHLK